WPALSIIMIILVAFSWGGVAIISRSMALSIKSEPYVEAAKALGASTTRIIFRHIIPQIIPYAMAALVFGVPSAIIAEAGLSVLGIDHGLPTWGRLLADAQANRGVAYNMWWWVLPPGLLLGLFSFAFVALGFTLETIVEPRLRRR
ncbi:MAG: ABC transporter permease subunit, partial [Acidilobaceae archaeon]